MAQLSDYQKDILIKTALGEARGEGVEGMADVLQVILNRANSGQFPSDPAKVALQNKQFSTWNAGKGGNNPSQFKPGSKAYQTAAQALEAVASGSRPDPTGGALYYHTPSVSPGWASGVNTNGTIQRNGHVFYPSRPVPPGDIPSVATLLDTRRAPPTPAIPSIAAAQLRANSSPSGGNTQLQTALNAYATSERNRVTPATMQGRATTVASFPTTSSLTTPGAVNASVNSTRQQPALAAALAQRLNPVSASDKTRGSAAQTRNVATTIASIPTVAPARLPSIPQSTIGRAPATRAVTTTRITPSASDMARAAARAPVAAPRVPLTIGAQSSFAGQDRAPALSQARLGASAPGLPALYGTMSQNRVNSIGLPLSNQVSPTSGFRVTSAAPTPLARPGVFGAAQPQVAQRAPTIPQRIAPVPASTASMNAARNGVVNGNVFTPPQGRPITSAFINQAFNQAQQAPPPVVRQPMPMAQPARAPLAITINGSNTIQPAAMTPMQALQAQGLTNAEAYARLTGGANPDAASRVNGKSGLSSSGGSYTKGYEF